MAAGCLPGRLAAAHGTMPPFILPRGIVTAALPGAGTVTRGGRGPHAQPRPPPLRPAAFARRPLGCWPRGSPRAQEAQGAGPALAGHALGTAEAAWEWRWDEITEEVLQLQRNCLWFLFKE